MIYANSYAFAPSFVAGLDPREVLASADTPFFAPMAILAQGGGGLNFFLMLAQTLAALALVCGLAYVLFRWVLPRLQITGSANRLVRVVDVAHIGPRRSLHVIEVAGRWLLVASSEAGVQLISELDSERASEAALALERARPKFDPLNRTAATTTMAARTTFADQLARLMGKRR